MKHSHLGDHEQASKSPIGPTHSSSGLWTITERCNVFAKSQMAVLMDPRADVIDRVRASIGYIGAKTAGGALLGAQMSCEHELVFLAPALFVGLVPIGAACGMAVGAGHAAHENLRAVMASKPRCQDAQVAVEGERSTASSIDQIEMMRSSERARRAAGIGQRAEHVPEGQLVRE